MRRELHRTILRMSGVLAAVAVALAFWAPPVAAVDWPQKITAPEGTIVVYQPQPETLEGNVLTGLAAMSIEVKGKKEPIFGAFWFSADIDTNYDTGSALIRDVSVTRVKWPNSADAQEQRFTKIVEDAVPKSGFEISLDRLSASLATAQQEKKSLEDLKNEPPVIVFSDTLAVLLLYDGDPKFTAIENSSYERALNTPLAVVRDAKTQTCYLSSGVFWYEAKDPVGPWSPTSSPPKDLVKMMSAAENDDNRDDKESPKTPPKIVVATEPTELISTEGQPQWKTLPSGNVLYVVNTETPWLRDVLTDNMYVLLSGRWYRAKTTDGPWTFVRADELPKTFQDIPPASDIGGVRTSVAGTDEAKEAVLDQQVPQTAAIKRSEATLKVEYDGQPKFEKIAGTEVSYAVNTGAQVLEIGGRYYAVDNGVWYTSAAATGPWAVADQVPEDEIQKIPPSSPVYNTTYVHIYESTPDIVYVGYYPGYLWSFPYYGVPVYGTGWYYPPYWGHYYYPRPATWGFHVGYNPWTGWNFGVSWSNGFFSFGASWGGGWGGSYYRPWGCCGGWYGGGYRRPVYVNTGDINIGNSINVGNRASISNRIDSLDRSQLQQVHQTNLYDRPEVRARNADPAAVRQDLERAKSTRNLPNDVFADKNGNVARRVGDEWQTRDQGQWKPSQLPEAQAANRSRDLEREFSQLDRGSLDRAYSARQSGQAREMRRPTGARRGGGRRR